MKTDNELLDQIIEQALKEEQSLPQGLSERLERNIEEWKANERSMQKKRKMFFLTSASIAAAVVLALIIFPMIEQSDNTHIQLADTYTNPAEAAIVAEEALLLISETLNKGVTQATTSISKPQEITQQIIQQIK